MKVHVVDNDSADGTVEMIAEEFSQVRITACASNTGFAAANNLAIRDSHGEYVLALNPDTAITAGALDTLLALMDAHPEVGITGCRLQRRDGSLDHAARRSFPTITGAIGHFLGVGRRDRVPKALSQYRATDVEEGPVDAVNGAFMLMRRSALEKVGLFDEGYWMYMEDLDLCYRFAQAGWVTWYEPSVTVLHVKAGTSGPIRSARLNYAFHYGMYRFYRKHYAPQNSAVTNVATYLGIGAKLAVSLVRAELRRPASTR
jgi:N-acetylglucosaminyl-diphospho-decaprenol L-rhamnosyltransferase